MRIGSYLRAMVVVAVGCATSWADQPPLLNLDTGGSLLQNATSVGAQDFRLSSSQRGVTASGAARTASPFGWMLHADPAAVDEVSSRMFGPIDLVTGGVVYSDTQLVLPAYATWPIGVSYNCNQTAGHLGGGMQGRNWFQNSQPSITEPDVNGVVRLFYSANAFVEYKRIDSSNFYAGVNGAGGVMELETISASGEQVQVYRLRDQLGTDVFFFGFESQLNASGAKGQLWKYTTFARTKSGATAQTAFVGDADKPLTAANTGYSNGRIVFARDSAGRKFEYAYTTVGGVSRLTSVTALTSGGSPTTIAVVSYAYYGSAEIGNTTKNNGEQGDLARIRITLPTSFPAAGSDPAIEDLRENRFYYAAGSLVKLIAGYEGTRRHLVAAGGSPVSWDANAATLAAALNSRAELRATYTSSTPIRVTAAWFAGMDGNNDQPAGEHTFSFEGNGGFTPPAPFQSRAIVKLPAFSRYADAAFSGSSAETTGHVWLTQYFDVLGQPLSSVVSDRDPAASGALYWLTGVVRDSDYRLKAVHTPANASGYNHTANNASRGTWTASATVGLVNFFKRYAAPDERVGLASAALHGTGVGSAGDYAAATYVSSKTVDVRSLTLSATPAVKLRRPYTTHVRTYPVATTSPTTPGSFNETQYTYEWWGSTLVPREVLTTLPAVGTANNGSGVSDTLKTWYSHVGQPILSRAQNGRLDTSEYDATTGLLSKSTTDAPTPTSGNLAGFADLAAPVPTVATISFETDAYNLQTLYTRDELGRLIETSARPGTGTAKIERSYYTRLSDRRLVRIDVPAVTASGTTTYYGPFSASVVNHLAVVEEGGLISPASPTAQPSTLSQFSTTAAPRTWLAEPTSTLAPGWLTKAQFQNTAGNNAALVSFSAMLTSPDGSRVVEARRYTTVPTSADTGGVWLGQLNTANNNHNYDHSLTRYNGMGLVDREEDITATIDRYGFDTVGRMVRHTRGTVETGTPPAMNMRPQSTIVYDGTAYGTTAAMNTAGGNGQVTQVWRHPSGVFGGTDDVRSYIRHDGLDNAVNLWGDEGPFLAASVDNLGRMVEAAAFNGTAARWNTALILPTSPYSDATAPVPPALPTQPRLRHAQHMFDELGRVHRMSQFAVNPLTGVDSATPGDTLTTDVWRGPTGKEKMIAGATVTKTATNRVCQVKMSAVCVTSNPGDMTPQARYTAAVNGLADNQMVVAQTNTYMDPSHYVAVAQVTAQRGTPGVSNTGAVATTGLPPARGLLMDLPYTTQGGWMQVQHNPTTDLLLLPEPTGGYTQLLLKVRTTQYDGLLLMPKQTYDFGDPLRHTSPPEAICCGINCPDLFPGPGGPWPYSESEVEYDPRRIICKTITTDWASGDQHISAGFRNAAGQMLHSVTARRHVNPADIGLPELPPDIVPLSNGCCDSADRVDNTFDRGRLRLERMFPCDQIMVGFNPLSPASYCAGDGCSKDSAYGYPDLFPIEDMFPPDFDAMPPNDNNRLTWRFRPTGANPGLGWNTPSPTGADDADWFVYDNLGRLLKRYAHPYRKPDFGDGNAAPGGNVFDRFTRDRAGRLTEALRPSGDITRPFEHRLFDYDMLGRPKRVRHLLGNFTPPPTPVFDDEAEFSYDRFGMLGEYRQRFKGMFPASCTGSVTPGPGPTDDWIICGIEREGTPQQSVMLGGSTGTPITPWQGPRVVRNTFPGGGGIGGREVSMAYFPNPAGTNDNDMFTGAGADGLLMELRLDWAMGRTRGVYEGNGTNHYQTPVASYGYLGMEIPYRRGLPGAGPGGTNNWRMLPTPYIPTNNGTGGGTQIVPTHLVPDFQHRPHDDDWSVPIHEEPNPARPRLPIMVDGHHNIAWLGNRISSMLDPATTPDFGGSGESPVKKFDIHGHDEFIREDCQGRPLYWLSGQASKMVKGPAESVWNAGRTSPVGINTAAPTTPTGVTEAEFRWSTPDTGCGTTGGPAGWIIASGGAFNSTHPLSPKDAPPSTEWAQHPVIQSIPPECTPWQRNSRTNETNRLRTNAAGTGTEPVSGFPVSSAYDAAGNLKRDPQGWYQYDGANRMTDAFAPGSGGTPGPRSAHFDYDSMGRKIASKYDTDGDGSLADEDTEWTPCDYLGRPLGVWRQPAPTTGTPNPCARPYQLFGHNSTGMRGGGYDAGAGILDCPAIRWRDTDSNGSLDETLYYLQDLRGDITALSSDKGIVERVRYGLTGRPESFPAADVNFDGVVDDEDEANFADALAAYLAENKDYDPRADLVRDGIIDSSDQDAFDASYGRFKNTAGNWKLTSGPGLTPGATGEAAGFDNRFGWRGYWYDRRLERYHVRHRVYDPREGRWMQIDPLGFGAGDADLYRYTDGNYSTGYDPLGLAPPRREYRIIGEGGGAQRRVETIITTERRSWTQVIASAPTLFIYPLFGSPNVTIESETYGWGELIPALGITADEFISAVDRGELPDGVSPEMIEWRLATVLMADTALDSAHNLTQDVITGAALAVVMNSVSSVRSIAATVKALKRGPAGTAIAVLKDGSEVSLTAAQVAEIENAAKTLRAAGKLDGGSAPPTLACGLDGQVPTSTTPKGVRYQISGPNPAPTGPNFRIGGSGPAPEVGTPNSIYLRTTSDGKVIQSVIYNKDGRQIGHVDWKDLHGHEFPPGSPSAGHGPQNRHIPLDQLDPGWIQLPPGVAPVAPRNP